MTYIDSYSIFSDEQKYPDIKETNNNGLEYTVQVLEEIYKNKDFPANAPSLSVSLRDSGKSRADLWAYSTVLAVEYGVETNNRVCDDPTVNDPGHQCHHQQGLEGCKVQKRFVYSYTKHFEFIKSNI